MNVGIILICILALSLITLTPQAFACSCAAEWSIEDDFEEAESIIFSGKAVDVKTQQYSFLVTFEIDQSWKGIPGNVTSINVMTSLHSASCGYNFAEDNNYLVVANGKWNQTPNVSSCGSTTSLASANEEISFLNKIANNDYSIGEVSWGKIHYPLTNNTAVTIQVIDSDMNKITSYNDTLTAFAYSDSYQEGIMLTLYEIDKNSGIFERTFVISELRSAPNILYTRSGDTITAKYIDTTLPPPYLPTDELELLDTAIVGNRGPPLERVPASSFRTQAIQGDIIKTSTILVDQQVLLVADIKNQQDREQDFAFFVQIQDENKVIVSLSWITGKLTPSQSFSPAQSWIPQYPGKYIATVFVWESLNNPSALSPPQALEIDVIE